MSKETMKQAIIEEASIQMTGHPSKDARWFAKSVYEYFMAEQPRAQSPDGEATLAREPLTDEQCDAIYTALDEWSREVDAHDFGLPAVAGGGIEKGREIIKTALGITKGGAQ